MTVEQVNQKHGAFFAFGKEQFEEQRESGVSYAQDGNGLFVPKDNVDAWMEDYKKHCQ